MKSALKILSRYSQREKDLGPDFSNQSTLTKQSFKDSCDINLIIKRFQTTGQVPENLRGPGQSLDLSDHLTYQESLNVVINAQNRFDSLPSKVRERFANDPIKFLQFVHDDKNADEMVKLGIALPPEPSPEPQKDA